MAWFRVYDTLPDNPKMQRLPDPLFKACINLWCIAKRNGGPLPCVEDVAFALRVPVAKVSAWLAKLKAARLMDEDEHGTFTPHDWNEHQYESDSSTPRVKKHREKRKAAVSSNAKGNGDETLHETHQNRTETEQRIVVVSAREAIPADDPEDPLEIPKSMRREGREEYHRLSAKVVELVWGDPEHPVSHAQVAAWLNQGADGDLDILPTIQRVMAQRNGQSPPRSLAYFNQAVADAMATRLRPLPPGTPGKKPEPVEDFDAIRREMTGAA